MSQDDVGELLEEQIAYCRTRAAEYDATSWETEPARKVPKTSSASGGGAVIVHH